jgi:hydroxymethylglutaryl-CoA lyase
LVRIVEVGPRDGLQNEKTPVAGNVATEDVVYMLEGMGIATGVDMQKLVAATNVISRLIGRPPVSRVAAAINAKMRVASSE